MQKTQIRPLRRADPRTVWHNWAHVPCAREVDLIRSSAGVWSLLVLWLPSVIQRLPVWVPWPSHSAACPLLAWRPGPRGSLWPQGVSVFAGAVDLDLGALVSGYPSPPPAAPVVGRALPSESRKVSTPTSRGKVFFFSFSFPYTMIFTCALRTTVYSPCPSRIRLSFPRGWGCSSPLPVLPQ